MSTKEPPTLQLKLMRLADQAYDGLGPYFDPSTGARIFQDHVDNRGVRWTMLPANGDTLAAYVVCEISDACHDYDGSNSADEYEALTAVRQYLTTAIHDLENVTEALSVRLGEIDVD